MNKNHKKKQLLFSKLLTAILGMCFFTGGGYSATAGSYNNENTIAASVQQQAIVSNGTVVDAQNEPVIGATVMEKGTSNGTATDRDGKFSLHVQPNATLVIIYLGFQTQEVKAGKDLRIVFAEDNQALEEVVVIGYGVQKKKLVTGATVQVKGEDIARLNTPTILGALQSQAPGVEITQTSGFIGDGFKVNIRGLGTNGTNTPLYVVDGVPNASIDGISPNDIESIDVLKDAATAAIYGVQAANGVILITTKKGKSGKYEVTYDGYYGVQNLYKIPTILNAGEYMAIQDESQIINGLPAFNWANFLPRADLEAIQKGTWTGTNWLKEVMNKNAPTQSHSLSITSGTERTNTAMGVTYLSQDATMGVPSAMPNLQKVNFRLNTEQVVYKRYDWDLFKVGETMNYRYQIMHGTVPRDDIYWNSVHNMLIMSPLMHPYNASGEYYILADQQADGYNWDVSNSANKNPIAYMDYTGNQNISKSYGLQASVFAELQPIKNLKFRSQFGYTFGASSYRAYTPAYKPLSSTVLGGIDRVTQSQSIGHSWSLDNTLNYLFDLAGGHNFDVLLGQSIYKSGYGESVSGSNTESSFTDFDHAWLSNVPGKTVASLTGSPYGESALSSFFGRVNYNYQEKYLASLIMRADGSSVFARGNRWGYFPSASAGWVISNEDFWQESVKGVDFLKLRLSYGQNGNSRVTGNQHLALITTSGTFGYPFGNSMGDPAVAAYPMRLINPDLKWETQTMINLGIDTRFLHNRFSWEFDAYQRKTVDWLVLPPIPVYLGSGAAYANGGDVKNTGFESIFRWNDHAGKDFVYGANLSIGFNKNEVTKIANENGYINGSPGILWGTAPESYRMEVGKPLGFFYGYKTAGVFQNQAEIDNYQGPKLGNPEPGDLIWVDSDENGTIDENDRTMIGNPHPDMTLGFSFNVGYKGFDLSVTTYGAFGHQIMKCYRDFVSSPLNNYTTDVFKRWHGEGTSNRLPKLASSSSTNYSYISDIYVEDGDYLKIKNITLGYDFVRLFPKLPVKQLKVYVTAQNLFTFTGYSGMDPEIGYSAGETWTKGIDLGFYPSARTYMVGASIKF
ncbi:MAG: TonB-dependent receptor [Dysgonamonadaceae bacterium]|jgi:TonB-linked SusC/RagA family outer membrane protein|nr:TonB-dependent receptor [Dysgonamonadaceae bacterium]